MAQNSKRNRGNQRRRPGQNINRAFDSNGPEVKIRGTATQIYDKYVTLARDAQSAGDRIRAESLLQHAEHYYRVMKSMAPTEQPRQPQQQQQPDPSGEDQPDMKDVAKDEPAKEKAEDASGDSKDDDGEDAPKPKRTRRKRISRKATDDEKTAESEVATEAVPAE